MRAATQEIAPRPLITKEDKDQFASLYQLYKIDDTGLAMSFIRKHHYLIELLFEAYREIRRVFGQGIVEICLEYNRDPEEDFEGLFVIVKTNLSPEESLDLLDKFDEEWFLDNVSGEIGSIFTVTVRPV